mgnify:FL=1
MTRVTMVDDMACRNNGKDINRVTSIAAETLITAYIYQWRDEDGHSQTEFIISILQQVHSYSGKNWVDFKSVHHSLLYTRETPEY